MRVTLARNGWECRRSPPPTVGGGDQRSTSAGRFLHQQPEDAVEVLVGHVAQFLIRAVLHGVLNEHVGRVGAERLGLGGGGVDELGGGDTDRRDAVGLEIRKIMRTARCAGASVRQAFDDDVDFRDDLLAQGDRRRLRNRRLHVALDGDATLGQPFVQPIEEHIAAGFRDVEQPHRQPLQAFGSGQSLS